MFAYFGGKARMGDWLAYHIPTNISTYVEPFGGAYWTYFRSSIAQHMAFPDINTIVYNDFNKMNVNLFNAIKDYKKFIPVVKEFEGYAVDLFKEYRLDLMNDGPVYEDIEAINKEIISIREPLFYEYRDFIFKNNLTKNFDCDTIDYEAAVKYVYLATHVFSGTTLTPNVTIPAGHYGTIKFVAFIKKLNDLNWQNKINAITNIENLDYKEVIQKYDSPKTFFYIDPPYFKVAKYTIDTFENIREHRKLAEILQNIKGRFVLSYYDFIALSKWYPKDKYHWITREYKKFASLQKGDESKIAEELIILNFDSGKGEFQKMSDIKKPKSELKSNSLEDFF